MIRTCIALAWVGKVPGSVGIPWATWGTPGIPIITNAQTTEFAPTAIQVRTKHRRGRALNEQCSTVLIVPPIGNAVHPVRPRYTIG
jgi:hypothetical protein